MRGFEGKYAVITGAASGISYETALILASCGAKGIIIADLNLEGATDTADAINHTTSCTSFPFQVNVAVPKEIEDLFAFASEKFSLVDILINGAGICTYETIEDLDADKWDREININLRGSYLCAREAFKYMKKQNYGNIVNISSIAGRVGGIASSMSYSASKGGIISLTMSLAKAGARFNIRANAVAPGVILTPLSAGQVYAPGTIIGEPYDVAEVIAFLASDSSKHITGCTLDVNGGAYMS